MSENLQEILRDLQKAIGGEVKFDLLTRNLYSTDASCYRMMPAGVVIPRTVDDVAATMEIASRHQVSVVPRGSGTSVSGQTVGPGLIIDHSRYVDRILQVNPEERWVKAQAGVVLDQLNSILQPHDLMVGPDPASSGMATLGGMTGNNSTGMHSIRHGMMADHVRELEVVLSDGSRANLGPRTPAEVEMLARQSTLEGLLYREIPKLVEQYHDDIATRYPHTWRNVAGYNLNYLLADRESGRPFNLATLIVGSEGTLANVVSVTLNIVPRPRCTRLLVLQYAELRAALQAVPVILEHRPAAVELMDRFMIRLTRCHAEYGGRLNRFVEGDPRVVLVVELADDDTSALAGQAHAIEETLRRHGYQGNTVNCTTADEISNVWTVRKASGGLLMGKRGDAKPWAFADDATVPIEQLPSYTAAIERACREAGTEVSFAAHVSAGCLHINPVVNLKTPEGLTLMRTICTSFAEIAIAHHGTTSGEHGEGLARSYFNEKLYGPRLHRAFGQVKQLFDPYNRLNPGKIIDAPAPWTPEILRFNPDYRTPYTLAKTHLDFSADGGFAGMVEMCYGQADCRRRIGGTMCPSFRVTRDESHSTRGRANALRAAMTGQLGPNGMTSRELYDVLDLCLECKACRRECSSLVDMAKLKYEFLAHYHTAHGVPVRSRLFGHITLLNRLGSVVPSLTNRIFQNELFRRALERLLGISCRHSLPPLAAHSFRKWFANRPTPPAATRGPVILWDDTYVSYNEPDMGQATVRVLEAAGFEVRLIAKRKCCGRPMISKGLLTEARRNAAHNVALLAPFAAQGISIVGIEPSCIATFRDEYPDLLRSREARLVAEHSFFIEEFLADLAARDELDLAFATPGELRHILVHGHCYQKAITGTAPVLKMLSLLPNTAVEEIPSGCCGMAGSFGYEKEHYELSRAVGEEILLPAVRAAAPDTIIAASGTSCRHQILEGTGRKALHPIVGLAEALYPIT
ncbi:MAG: FAD-linked oxidase C-terminal domain-containing protein [Acidobacteriota bacterium]